MATKHIWKGGEVAPIPGFTYDDEAHKYALNGRPLKSITGYTSRLRDHSFVNPIDLEWGSHVHNYLYLHDLGKLLPGGDPRMLPYILGWTEFRERQGWDTKKMLAEFPNCSEKYLIAGRLDRLFETEKWDWLIDIKTGPLDKTVGLQLSAYGGMALERKLTTISRLKLMGVSINALGKCKAQIYSFKENWSFFLMQYSLQNYLAN